jgi:hypothetical protein
MLYLGRLDRDVYALYGVPGNGVGIYAAGSNNPSLAIDSSPVALLSKLYPSLLIQSRPRPTVWLASAVNRATQFLDVKDRSLAVLDSSPLNRRPLIPLAEVARILNRSDASLPATAEEAEAVKAALDTAALFAQWALFAEEGKYRAAFWDFYLRSARDPDAGEPLFQSCFSLSYVEILPRLVAYRDSLQKIRRIPFPKSSQAVSPAKVRDATPAEIARITGEWTRLVAPLFPAGRDQLLAKAVCFPGYFGHASSVMVDG